MTFRNEKWAVAVTEEQRQQIQALIDALPEGETYHSFDDLPQPNFKSLNALPVLFDSGGVSVLRPDGTWMTLLWYRPVELTDAICVDARIERMLRFEAAQRYPDLRWLVPDRPVDAVDCPDCSGVGISPATSQMGVGNVVCWCGGLGWLLTSET